MRRRFVTEVKGWKAPNPGDVETMRQFWDATLDRLAAFMQAKHRSDRHAAGWPRGTMDIRSSDGKADPKIVPPRPRTP